MSEKVSQQIDRDEWLELFEHGYGLGQQERHREPENRRADVTEIHEAVDYSGTQLEAMQEGYEVGRDEW